MTEPASDPQRSAQRLQWARTQLDDANAVVERASVDAGMRSYWRATSTRGSHIVMDAPPGLEDPRPWLRMRGNPREADRLGCDHFKRRVEPRS